MLTVIMGAYFNIFIMLPNISMTYPKLVYSIVGLYSHFNIAFVLRLLWPLVAKNSSNEQQMMSNFACYIRKYYNSYISVVT